jgi:hypothetical protein
LVVQPKDTTQEPAVLWVMKGEPRLAYSGGTRHDDPLEQIAEITEGWFTFIQAEIDRDKLRMIEAWSRGAQPDEEETPVSSKTPVGLRDRLNASISSARNIGEIRDAVQSVLDAGIDRAAEDDDTLLMDRLADVSILLQKDKIEEASALLTALLR